MNACAEHLEQLQEIVEVQGSSAGPRPRGQAHAAQEPRRRLEQRVRRRAVHFYHGAAQSGDTLAQAAERLHLSPRTLRQWDYACRIQDAGLAVLGRPPHLASPAERAAVRDFLESRGPALGVPGLRRQFPMLARAQLAELLADYRQAWRQQGQSVRVLHWQTPGCVWAIDYAAPALLGATSCLPPIDGIYPHLLAVRDLASGYQLAWLPVADATAARTQAVLAELCRAHGAPLVLKMDNGPPFRAQDTKAFLEEAGVFALFSPPACPGYNGSIEAAIGSLKRRTQEQAERRHAPGYWTSEDVQAARQEANASHPPRLNGRTPAHLWERRQVVGVGERFRFALSVEEQRASARQELGMDAEELLDHWQQGKVDRKALERALVEHEYLLFTRRRIPLTIRRQQMTLGV